MVTHSCPNLGRRARGRCQRERKPDKSVRLKANESVRLSRREKTWRPWKRHVATCQSPTPVSLPELRVHTSVIAASGESEREREFGQREASCQTNSWIVVGELWRRKSLGCCTWTRKAVNCQPRRQASKPTSWCCPVPHECSTEPHWSHLAASVCETFTRAKRQWRSFLAPLRWDSCFLSRTLLLCYSPSYGSLDGHGSWSCKRRSRAGHLRWSHQIGSRTERSKRSPDLWRLCWTMKNLEMWIRSRRRVQTCPSQPLQPNRIQTAPRASLDWGSLV